MQKNKALNYRLFLATRRYLAMGIVFGLTSTLLLLTLGIPRIGSLSSVNGKIKAEKQKLDQLNTKARELSQLDTMPEFQNREKVNDVLPSHKPLLELIANLNASAINSQVSVSEFAVNPGKIASKGAEITTEQGQKGKPYDALKVTMKAKGTVNQLESFFKTIEQISPITTITSLSLNRQSTNTSGPDTADIMAEADLELSTFFYTQSVNTTIEATLPKIGQKEVEIFNQILEFSPANITPQTEIEGGGAEDLFGIQNLEELQQMAKNSALTDTIQASASAKSTTNPNSMGF